jgi:hypothetical protein
VAIKTSLVFEYNNNSDGGGLTTIFRTVHLFAFEYPPELVGLLTGDF